MLLMFAAIAKSTPVPLKLKFCGLPAALSLIDRVPVRLPAVDGTKTMLMMQLAPGLSEAPQLVICEKSPVVVVELKVRVALPVLLSVTL